MKVSEATNEKGREIFLNIFIFKKNLEKSEGEIKFLPKINLIESNKGMVKF